MTQAGPTIGGRLTMGRRQAVSVGQLPPDAVAALDRLAAVYRAGRIDEATDGYTALAADLARRGLHNLAVFERLVVVHYVAGRHEQAAETCRSGLRSFPRSPVLQQNLGMCLAKLQDFAGAIEALNATLALGKRHWSVHDGLAYAYAYTGRLPKAREHGIRSLTLKDEEAAAANPAFGLPDGPPPPFEARNRTANVIAFSLWGGDPRYTVGVLRNALLIPEIYPGWVARVFVGQGVPAAVVDELTALGAEVVRRDGPSGLGDGLFWRFEVACDPTVARFLIRDADSVVNTQERAAVDDWLASGRYFHVMRDWWTHTDPMLAGMWGGVGGMLPDLADLRARFKPDRLETLNVDQDFLRMMVWPVARTSCLTHDSYYDCLGSRPFPPTGRLPPGMHVGQDHRGRRIRRPTPRDARR